MAGSLRGLAAGFYCGFTTAGPRERSGSGLRGPSPKAAHVWAARTSIPTSDEKRRKRPWSHAFQMPPRWRAVTHRSTAWMPARAQAISSYAAARSRPWAMRLRPGRCWSRSRCRTLRSVMPPTKARAPVPRSTAPRAPTPPPPEPPAGSAPTTATPTRFRTAPSPSPAATAKCKSTTFPSPPAPQ